MEITSLSGKVYLLRLELAYSLFLCFEAFRADCVNQEVVQHGYKRFWYTNSSYYYLESVYDFYDRMEIDEDAWHMRVKYRNTIHTISIEVITATMNVPCEYITEQFPSGYQALNDWVNEIIPGGQIQDAYVKLGSLYEKKLLFQRG